MMGPVCDGGHAGSYASAVHTKIYDEVRARIAQRVSRTPGRVARAPGVDHPPDPPAQSRIEPRQKSRGDRSRGRTEPRQAGDGQQAGPIRANRSTSRPATTLPISFHSSPAARVRHRARRSERQSAQGVTLARRVRGTAADAAKGVHRAL